jgi:CRISPR-associated protein Cmr4
MFDSAKFLSMYTETPLHAGSGASVSWVDLPIQREGHTGHPMIQASGVKGALRSRAEQKKEGSNGEITSLLIDDVFGPDDDADRFAGCLGPTDARLLLFPVRSFKGVFAWITCPLVLERLFQDLARIGEAPAFANSLVALPAVSDENSALVTGHSALQLQTGKTIVLEVCSFSATQSDEVDLLAEFLSPLLPREAQPRLASSLTVVSDDTFTYFAEFATEVITRIRKNETGTVEEGALWSQELLPTDSLLYSLILASRPRHSRAEFDTTEKVLNFLFNRVINDHILQLGGDETVGRGVVHLHWFSGKSKIAEQGAQDENA